jgi:hypothetical protein
MILASQFCQGGSHDQGYQGSAASFRGRDFETHKADEGFLEGPSLAKMTSLILPYANTEMMNIFLKQISDDFTNYFVLMLVDQAGWHKSMELKVSENIRLIEQP